jgi:hypothetical protein
MKWDTTKQETYLIMKIMDRAFSSRDIVPTENRMTMMMDITACHLNGNRLDLEGLFKAKEPDFFHDVCGISRYINRKTGKMTECFSPRYSK